MRFKLAAIKSYKNDLQLATIVTIVERVSTQNLCEDRKCKINLTISTHKEHQDFNIVRRQLGFTSIMQERNISLINKKRKYYTTFFQSYNKFEDQQTKMEKNIQCYLTSSNSNLPKSLGRITFQTSRRT